MLCNLNSKLIISKFNSQFPQITKEDFLPKKVCERCISKIEQFFEWRTNSVQTDNIFKNYAESMRQVTATINFQVSYWVLYPESLLNSSSCVITLKNLIILGRNCEH